MGPIVTGEMGRVTLMWGARLTVGAILLLGGVGKALYFKDFKKVLAAYQLLPADAVMPASIVLIAGEILCGFSMFVTGLRTIAGFWAIGLFGIFIAAISINLIRGRQELPCGCFGKDTELLSWVTVARNVALIGLSILAMGRLFAVPLMLVAIYAVVLLIQGIRKSPPSVARSVS